MTLRIKKNGILFLTLFSLMAILSFTSTINAQEETEKNDAVAQANNPLANFTAFNVHNYYIGELTAPEQDANQVWARFAKPFSLGKTNWLMRASLPLNTFPVAPDFKAKTGLGDLNIFAAWLLDVGNPTLAFGVGPQITVPTATVSELGSQKWSAGIVNTLFSFKSKTFQYGYLLSWQASFAGEEDREDVNVGAFQPFLFYQLGKGSYLRSTGAAFYNFTNDIYGVPVGLGFGKVIPKEKTVFNVFIEPQLSIADSGPGVAKWQIFVGLNTQFK
ncbi:hypothetical protein [Eudoraea adriatica]|uniref:hypothetical protein n=1 Tax=Eudoraea adriatica TaxID=446681 RepID=UPI00035E4781|nr:hypothetical protein [Eudoraea adriatica]